MVGFKVKLLLLCLTTVHVSVLWLSVKPESGAVVLNGLLELAAVFQKVSVVVMSFGIVRKCPDTRPEIGKNSWDGKMSLSISLSLVPSMILPSFPLFFFAYRNSASLDSQTWFWWTVFHEKDRRSSTTETLTTVVPYLPTTVHRRPTPRATRIQ